MLVIMTFVIMTFVIMTFVIVAVFKACLRSLGLVRLWIVFDCVGRAQRFAFHALCAPNKMPDWEINGLF
jgi:hypothetical protein